MKRAWDSGFTGEAFCDDGKTHESPKYINIKWKYENG